VGRTVKNRFLIAVGAACLAVGGIVSSSASAAAVPTEDLSVLARDEFYCPRTFSDEWNECYDSTVTVPAGHQLRAAVRGSRGKGVNFQARDTGGRILGTNRSCIEVGDPSVPVWTNNTGRPVTTVMWVALCEAGGAYVDGTQYY
jgi:hypothetical protein